MRIDTETVSGWRTCAADRTLLDEDCPGYESEPLPVVREEVISTFGDRAAAALGDQVTTSDPYAPLVSDSRIHVRPLREGDDVCPYCSGPAALSLEPRPTYMRLSEQTPDEAVRRARGERQLGLAQVTASERQAAALEMLAASGNGELAQLRAEIEALKAALNGHDAPESAVEGEADPAPTRPVRARQKARQ